MILRSALVDSSGALVLGEFVERLFSSTIWGLGCLSANTNCGVAWNTLILAVLTGLITTLLGLACALLILRTGMPGKRAMRLLTVLPIITPPFVIGLALILLFGRSGLSRHSCSTGSASRARAGSMACPACCSRRCSPSAPIAFLVLIGVVQGIAPSLEEASQTLGAKRWTTFRTVTWPLLRPGLANAFLLGFVESMADFGNPLVLGGNFEVLSTKIFFAVVGAAHNQGQAAVLAVVLLGFTLAAFWAQQRWLGGKSYTTVTGKGDSGLPTPLPRRITWVSALVIGPWVVLTAIIYIVILMGGFVKTMGRDYTPTLQHYITGFSIDFSRGLYFDGSAWPSFFTTLKLAAISAPLTAVIGLLTAYLLTRQRFAGRGALEFATHAELRHSRHRARRRLYPRLQRAAGRDHRYRADPRHRLRLPQHAGRRALRHRRAVADRQESGRGLGDIVGPQLHHALAGGAAAAAPGARRGAGLQLRAQHDDGERRDLPGLGRIQPSLPPISSAGSRPASSASPSPIPRC